jgi:hypothetical protein
VTSLSEKVIAFKAIKIGDIYYIYATQLKDGFYYLVMRQIRLRGNSIEDYEKA